MEPFSPSANIEVVLPSDGVLNYTTVDIPAGVTVTFQQNDGNTPVFILATGDVNIAGTVSVDGVVRNQYEQWQWWAWRL